VNDEAPEDQSCRGGPLRCRSLASDPTGEARRAKAPSIPSVAAIAARIGQIFDASSWIAQAIDKEYPDALVPVEAA
jgi:hypothetical protein